jgi:hypothetical protein
MVLWDMDGKRGYVSQCGTYHTHYDERERVWVLTTGTGQPTVLGWFTSYKLAVAAAGLHKSLTAGALNLYMEAVGALGGWLPTEVVAGAVR